MKIESDIDGNIVFKELYEPIVLETREGNRFVLAMRDDTIELSVVGSERFYRAEIETGEMVEM